jgi:DNA primase
MAFSPQPNAHRLAADRVKGAWRLSKDTLRLEEALDELGVQVTTKQADGEWVCRCPLPSHGGADNNPSLLINSKDLRWVCRSACGGGSITSFVEALRGVRYVEACEFLCRFTDTRNPEGQAFVNRIRGILDQPRQRPSIAPPPTLPWWPMRVLEEFSDPTDYYASRGISEEVVERLGLLFHMKHPRGEDGFEAPAAIIPHIFKGDLVGWQERWLLSEEARPHWLGKYTNTPDFPKKHTLYNYDQAADNPSAVVVVESALTVAKLLTAGIPAVATFGGSATPEQLGLLRRFRNGLILAYDNDDTGEAAVATIGEATFHHVPVTVVPPPEGEKADLGDLTIEEIHYKMTEARPYMLHRVSGFYK